MMRNLKRISMRAPLGVGGLGLPTRIVNRLEYEGIKTVRALCNRSPYDLLDLPGFGLCSIKEVRKRLQSCGGRAGGLELKDDPGPHVTWLWVTARPPNEQRAKENARRNKYGR
jgi:DNA-directed RNA polymerase alpha subunit